VRTFSGAVTTALASPAVGLVQLVRMGFTPTPVVLNSSNWNIAFGGDTYLGAAGLGTISAITDKPGEVQGVVFELAAGASSVISLALDAAGTVQGTPCTIRTAIVDASTGAVLDAPLEWSGTLDTMTIAEDGDGAVVRVTAESKAVDLLRGTPSFYADQDQILINATDRSFRYVADQIDKPIVWPARSFFYK
jgi:hypothetical protein